VTVCTDYVFSSISQKFSPYGRAQNAHLLRYQEIAVAYYGYALECLANERPAHVKSPGLDRLNFC